MMMMIIYISHGSVCDPWFHALRIRQTHSQSAGAVEYTDCISAER